MKTIVCFYIRLRYGHVYALKPPLGRNPFLPPSKPARLWYKLRKAVFDAECEAFEKHGKEMRDAWMRGEKVPTIWQRIKKALKMEWLEGWGE